MTLDTMGLMGGTDVLREIGMRLQESHLAYLQLDESPSKLQARQKLEGVIKEYLCHVPNERKYVFQETADILHRSAATVKDFSGYRACTAWRALSLYAANLLAQPWRKEYRTLRTYSGYYKHEIETNLIGAELMFELMGYKHTGLGVLTLEGPIDPDRVSNVSRDAIVAYVECQILKEIWENVSQKFTVSWLEVLEFRCSSVGTSEQAIRALNFRFFERLHHSREKNSSNPYRDYIQAQPIGIDATIPSHVQSTTIPYHAISNNYNATMTNICKSDNVYPSDGNYYFAPLDAINLTNRYVNPYVCRPATINHYHAVGQTQQSSNAMTAAASGQGHASGVPIGRLIELDSPSPLVNYEKNHSHHDETTRKSGKTRFHEYEIDDDDIDSRRNDPSRNYDDRHDYARIEKRGFGKLTRENPDEKNDDWEFVYKSLESRGYSKDLGERDDVLRKKELLLEGKNSSARLVEKNSRPFVNSEDNEKYDKYDFRSSRDDEMRNFNVNRAVNFNDFHLDLSNGSPDTRKRDTLEFRKKASRESRDYSLSANERASDVNFPNFEKNGKKYSNTLPISRNVYRGNADNTGTTRKFDSGEAGDNVKSNIETWNCATCTFLNSREREICEMCGKSRRKGNEDKPLASGGKECPTCTLVNDKNASTCEACSGSLKHSPTYI